LEEPVLPVQEETPGSLEKWDQRVIGRFKVILETRVQLETPAQPGPQVSTALVAKPGKLGQWVLQETRVQSVIPVAPELRAPPGLKVHLGLLATRVLTGLLAKRVRTVFKVYSVISAKSEISEQLVISVLKEPPALKDKQAQSVILAQPVPSGLKEP
jgi:hypothetical protein